LKIAVDTSAIMAILLEEPEALEFLTKILANEANMIGASLLEALIVLSVRKVESPQAELSLLTETLAINLIPFDAQMTAIAQDAFLRFGKGCHPAKLNFGDCMSYALAKSQGVPLLFKGDDFALTDVERAL
jgi:ribonuclease VapC